MVFSMPFVPPLKPGTIVAPVVFVFYSKTARMSVKLLFTPQHHVLVILGALVVEEGDGGGGGRPWLSQDTLRFMFTLANTWLVRRCRADLRQGVL